MGEDVLAEAVIVVVVAVVAAAAAVVAGRSMLKLGIATCPVGYTEFARSAESRILETPGCCKVVAGSLRRVWLRSCEGKSCRCLAEVEGHSCSICGSYASLARHVSRMSRTLLAVAS